MYRCDDQASYSSESRKSRASNWRQVCSSHSRNCRRVCFIPSSWYLLRIRLACPSCLSCSADLINLCFYLEGVEIKFDEADVRWCNGCWNDCCCWLWFFDGCGRHAQSAIRTPQSCCQTRYQNRFRLWWHTRLQTPQKESAVLTRKCRAGPNHWSVLCRGRLWALFFGTVLYPAWRLL